MGCAASSNGKIKTFLAKDISVFLFFGLNRNDAASLFRIVEKCDSKYNRSLDMHLFTILYCGEYTETFEIIWGKFSALLRCSRKDSMWEEKYNIVTKDESDDDEEENDQGTKQVSNNDAVVKSDALNNHDLCDNIVSYHNLLSFLLIFMSIQDSDLSIWIHWLFYLTQKTFPDNQSMEELINQLWGQKLKIKYEKSFVTLKKSAKNMLATVHSSELFPSKFRMFDITTGGAWTRPVRWLRAKLRSTILGIRFWHRVSVLALRASINLDQSYSLLEDPYKLSHWGKSNYAATGERRTARKFIRRLVRLQMSYLNMPLDNDDINNNILIQQQQQQQVIASRVSTKNSQIKSELNEKMLDNNSLYSVSLDGEDVDDERNGSTVVDNAINSIKSAAIIMSLPVFIIINMLGITVMPYAKIAPALMDIANNGESHLLSTNVLPATVTKEEAVVTTDVVVVPLEVLYKESLEVPLDRIFDRAYNAEMRTRIKLKLCEEELLFVNNINNTDTLELAGSIINDRLSTSTSSKASMSNSSKSSSYSSGSSDGGNKEVADITANGVDNYPEYELRC